MGTPALVSGEADLSYVEAVASAVAKHVDDFKIVVEKSTVPVLTHKEIQRVMMMNGAPLDSFDVVSNPEFLREGTAVMDFLFPDRIVIGADSERAAAILRQVYEPLTSGRYYSSATIVPIPEGRPSRARLLVTSAMSAELIKHASNSFLAMKISFINAVANICEVVGADIQEVCRGIGADARIGEHFLRPGIGYGGSCFPKDLLAFRLVARECGLELGLLDEIIKINEEQRNRFIRKVRSALWILKGKRIAALGLAFKGGTDDVRESPALDIVEALLQEGADVVVYDPAAMERAKDSLGDRVTYAASALEACDGAHAAVILTDWEEFAKMDLGRIRSALHYPIIIDGRNIFSCDEMRAAGFHYFSIGRPNVAHDALPLRTPMSLDAAQEFTAGASPNINLKERFPAWRGKCHSPQSHLGPKTSKLLLPKRSRGWVATQCACHRGRRILVPSAWQPSEFWFTSRSEALCA